MYFQLVTQAVPRASLQITENREGEKKKKPEEAGKILKGCLQRTLSPSESVTAEEPV